MCSLSPLAQVVLQYRPICFLISSIRPFMTILQYRSICILISFIRPFMNCHFECACNASLLVDFFYNAI